MQYRVKNKILFVFNLLFAAAVFWYGNFTPNSLYDRAIFNALSALFLYHAQDELEVK